MRQEGEDFLPGASAASPAAAGPGEEASSAVASLVPHGRGRTGKLAVCEAFSWLWRILEI